MRCFVMMPFAEDFDAVKESIRDAVGNAEMEFRRADDASEIGPITESIVREIERADICVADLTGKNPNVVWEVGYAMARKKPLVPIARGIDDLFFDLQDYRTIFYGGLEGEARLGEKLTKALVVARRNIEEMSLERFFNAFPRDGIKSVLGAKTIGGTPFGFFDLIKNAKKRVFCAAQNHYYFVQEEANKGRFKDAIVAFLDCDELRTVQIMLCDLGDTAAVETWTYVTKERYSRDLLEVTRFMSEFYHKELSEGLRTRISIRKVRFVPFSVTFIDPDDDCGTMVLVPNAYEEKNLVRPCFALSRKENDDIYYQYWNAYLQRFNDVKETNI